ncbi:MAG TPA: carboxypeptidase-like regulatory domain-containing protein [Parafilimonas sp.]|nr:carboxypeptidase-like regulatory domain-containing protein [Parafilimonas sp.]
MKKNFFGVFILSGCALFFGCKKEAVVVSSSSYNESITGKTGTVTGKATDSRGNVLQGVEVTVEHTVWLGTYLYATTNNKGKYNISIPSAPAGAWTAKARYSKDAYGKTYLFDMKGDTASFTRAEATVRNFKWVLSGKKPAPKTYYGAHVDLYPFGTDVQMDKIKIIFTPVDSILIDGSPAISFERYVEDVAGTFMVKDVPIGRYSIKAAYPGKKLYLENRHDNKKPAIKKTVVFDKYGFLGDTEYNIEFWVSE